MSKLPESNYIAVEAYATIDGRRVPISNFSCIFQLNEIPLAVIQIPLGRIGGGKDVGQRAPVADILTGLQPMTPVTVHAKLTPSPAGQSTNNGFPAGEFLLFTGFARGPAFSKNYESASAAFVVEAYGWPVALAGATQYITGTFARQAPSGGTLIVSRLGDQGKVTPILADSLLKDVKAVASNIWANGIRPVFNQIVANTSGWTGQANTTALEALTRYSASGRLPIAPLNLGAYPAAQGQSKDMFEKGIVAWLVNAIYNGWAMDGQDLWDTLQLLAETFMFRIISTINEGSIAPITLALGGAAYKVIEPSEYNAIDINAIFSPKYYAYPTACGLYAKGWQSSQWQDQAVETSAFGLAFVPSLGGKTGRFLLRPAPVWLLPLSAAARSSVNPGGAVPDASNPEDGKAPDINQGAAENNYFGAATPGNGCAAAILRDELFFMRQLSIRGKFRVDIAPGSLVQINTMGEVFAGQGQVLFGHVAAVKLELGIPGDGNGYASTTLNVVSVRSKTEHENGSLTVPTHPLYLTAWRGGPLSAEL